MPHLEENQIVTLVSLFCITCIKIVNFDICLVKSNLLTLELLYIVDVFVSIDAGAQVAIISLACGPCVVIVNLLGQVCTLGRAPRIKETLPDFRE